MKIEDLIGLKITGIKFERYGLIIELENGYKVNVEAFDSYVGLDIEYYDADDKVGYFEEG